MSRGPHVYLHGDIAIVPGRVVAYLERFAGLDEYRRANLGADPEVDDVLLAMHGAALNWRSSATGTKTAPPPEPEVDWVSTAAAAQMLALTQRAVVKAIAERRLPATNLAGRWRISRDALALFKTRTTK